ncbi:MAG: diguanylate cyclase domain-containing protein [Solidesulfovibrio sp. DCME]|uniref:diguanylate cyclase domain-containing protein n=1 Tax=Solidesulfovibrio sp. DCME TaxID=3447380 RepID=UPI003D14D8B6
MPSETRTKQRLAAEVAALTRRIAELEELHAQCLESERDLRRNEARYRRLLESVTDYVYTVAVRDGLAASTVHGPNCLAVTGYAAEEYRDNPMLWLAMVPEEDRPAVVAHAARVMAGDPAPLEHRILHKDGSIRYVRNTPVVHHDASGAVVSYDGIINDVTERRRAEELITRMSLHDGLTGLPNRALYMDRLRQTLHLAERSGEKAAVYFIDLDRFKAVNDAFGHEAGDRVLVEAARRLSACVRRSDTVARLGGDEFVALTPGVGDVANASLIAGKLVAAMRAPFLVQGQRAVLGASVGVALFPDDASRAGDLLRLADAAMYAAKNAGRNAWRLAGSLPEPQPAQPSSDHQA